MRYPDDLRDHLVEESNLIERAPTSGPYFNNHRLALDTALLAAEEHQVLHPRVLHGIMFNGLDLPRGLDGPEYQGGDYRQHNVYVNLVPKAARTPSAQGPSIHRFPEWPRVPELMQLWWASLQKVVMYADPSPKRESIPWRYHAWFESIHPFIDGNGRVGRVVMWNIEALAERDLTIVRYGERYDYYDRLQAWRNDNVALGV